MRKRRPENDGGKRGGKPVRQLPGERRTDRFPGEFVARFLSFFAKQGDKSPFLWYNTCVYGPDLAA